MTEVAPPSGETPPASDPSLLNQEEPSTDAPEAYEPFTVPDGYQLNEETSKAAQGIFKELNLDQAGAQKLVDFYSAQQTKAVEVPYQTFLDTRKAWVDQIKADPEIGRNLPAVKAEIGRALNSLGDAKLVADFKATMDLTGAGDNPAFVKAFYRLAQKVTEGRPVNGANPSSLGQQAPGSASRPTPAQAMYPNLPSSAVPG